MTIKIFHAYGNGGRERLESKVNEWLTLNPNMVIKDMQYIREGDGPTIVLSVFSLEDMENDG